MLRDRLHRAGRHRPHQVHRELGGFGNARVQRLRAEREADHRASRLAVVARTDAQRHDRARRARCAPRPASRRGSRRAVGRPAQRWLEIWRASTVGSSLRVPSTDRIRSPGRSVSAAAEPGATSATRGSGFLGAEREHEQQEERDHDVDRRARADHHDPLPHRLVVVGARRDVRRQLLLRVHPGDLHEAAQRDHADAVLGLARGACARDTAGRTARSAPTRMPVAFAATKWPSSCRMISAEKPTNARTQLKRAPPAARQCSSPCGEPRRPPRRGPRSCASGDRLARLERALDHARDVEEAQRLGQEGVHGDLVGGVQHAGGGAARGRRVAREREAAERLEVGRLEGQAADLGEVERAHRHVGALGVVQGIGDRHAHVGVAQMGERWRRRSGGRARARSTPGARPRRSARTGSRTGGAPRSARGPCSSAWPSRS